MIYGFSSHVVHVATGHIADVQVISVVRMVSDLKAGGTFQGAFARRRAVG